MKLTALEIKQQTFDKSFRGYDPAEVQAFLNLVANDWEHLVTKNNGLEAQIEKLNEKLKHFERVESALHETLQNAKDSAEQKLGGAKRESQRILEKAEMEADAIIREADQQRQEMRKGILNILERRKEIIGGIRTYLDIASESLDRFENDEAGLFKLSDQKPDPESLNKKNETDHQKEPSEAEEKNERMPSSRPPDSDGMDDILDQID